MCNLGAVLNVMNAGQKTTGVEELEREGRATVYPFTPDLADSPFSPNTLPSLFADARFTYENAAELTTGIADTIVLQRLDYQAGVFNIHLTWKSSGAVFIDTLARPHNDAVASQQYGLWTVLCARATLPDGSVNSFQAIVDTDQLAAMSWPQSPAGTLVFQPAIGENRGRKLRSLTVVPRHGPPVKLTSKQLTVTAGYNSGLTAVPGAGTVTLPRTVSTLTWAGGNGLGAGAVSACEASSSSASAGPLRTLSGVAPDGQGNVQLQTTGGCMWINRPENGSLISAATLQVHDNCHVCCSCEEYVIYYKALLLANKKLEYINSRIPLLVAKLAQITENMDARAAMQPPGVYAALNVYPANGWYVTLQLQVSHNLPCAIPDLSINIAVPNVVTSGSNVVLNNVAGSSWVTQPPATRVALEPVVTHGGGGGVTGLQLTPGCVMKSGTTVIHEITLLAAYPHTDAVHTASLQQFTATISGTGFSPVVVSTPAALLGPLNRVTPSPS